MKNILIAIDFSDASLNAARYGIELAAAFNARVILFTAYLEIPVAGMEPSIVLTTDEIKLFAEEKLKQVAKYLRKNKNVRIESICDKGSSVNAILKIAKKRKADLIVTGMKHKMKALRRVIGSTVTSLSKKSDIPLLMVPENATYAPPKTIAIAYKIDIAPKTNMSIIHKLSANFNSKIYLVRAVKPELKEIYANYNNPSRLVQSLPGSELIYECDGKKITHALTEFINKHGVKLLVMLHYRHSIPVNILAGSVTRAMAFETGIPLIILPAGLAAD